MHSEIYQQCELLHKNKTRIISWIPSKYAKKNNILKLHTRYDSGCLESYSEWEDGWKVIHVFNKKINSEKLMTLKTQYKQTRRASDV